jgi:hypothetical protein
MRRENLSLDDAMQSLTPVPLEFEDDLDLIDNTSEFTAPEEDFLEDET